MLPLARPSPELVDRLVALEELPPYGLAFGFLLVGTALFVPALSVARRRFLPQASRGPDPRWSLLEVLAVVALPFVLLSWLALLFQGVGLLAALVLHELAFGAAALLALFLARRRAQGLRSFGLGGPPRPRALLGGTLCFLALWPCLFGLGALWLRVVRHFGWSTQQAIKDLILSLQGGELALACVLAVVLGPFLEELLFRGFLQPALARLLGERGAILLSSVIFALLHGLAAMLPIFGLSLFLGWLQARSRNLLIPWSVHALNNGLVLALALATVER